MKLRTTTRGFGVVEILVAISIISITLIGLHTASVQAFRLVEQNTYRTQATFLLEETLEALRALRDTSWSSNIDTISVNTNYYLEWNGGAWTITTTNEFVDDTFERTFLLEDVYRDENEDIVSSGTLDDGTKKITATVAWHTPHTGTTTQTMQTYITDLFEN